MTAEYSNHEGVYYSDTDIARLLGITLGRLRNKLTAGSPLPPRIEPPGCRHRLWPCKAVHAWLDQFKVTTMEPLLLHSSPRRRGRPTKQET
ncbi:MAG: hypothetical protein IT488_01920, partial [Gammaproteobacteria bacterium]|nr:hypothetical protein [Gammaproteobacteria bacterium]